MVLDIGRPTQDHYRARIYLDGVEQKCCVTYADDELGIVERYVPDAFPTPNGPQTETLHGDVRIELV